MACQENSKSCDCRATAPIYLISHATGMERLPLGEGAKQKRAKPQNYKYHPGASSGCSANATWQKKRPQEARPGLSSVRQFWTMVPSHKGAT
jgi:hypothetical protein